VPWPGRRRGTIWHAGENTILGRDHTIHAAVEGWVKYYRDPARHPKRQYIGVVFDKGDKLPYGPHAVRKRKLNAVAVPIKNGTNLDPVSPSGIPRRVVRKEGFADPLGAVSDIQRARAIVRSEVPKKIRKRKWKETRSEYRGRLKTEWMRIKYGDVPSTRVLHLRKDDSYAEANSALGKLMPAQGRKKRLAMQQEEEAMIRARRRKLDVQRRRRQGLAHLTGLVQRAKAGASAARARRLARGRRRRLPGAV